MKYYIDTHDKTKGSFPVGELTEADFFAQFDALEEAAPQFGVGAHAALDKKTRDFLVRSDNAVAEILDNTPCSVSMFVTPTGELIGEVLQDEEGILYADIDVSQCVEPKQFHDISGGYNRFDIFDLRVNRTRLQPYSIWPE